MKILCVGGGPAGLYFSILMKQKNPAHQITVIERNRPDDTFGFGVIFSERTLGSLQNQDEEVYQEITRACRAWDPIEVHFRGKTLFCYGNGFSAISRQRLLTILQGRARDLGVEMRFQTDFGDLSLLSHYDLVVAADGLNSLIRRSFGSQFQPTIDTGRAKYAWFGTTKRFTALTFLFEENEDGVFGVHAYPFDEQTSTFIVETDEQTWRRAGLDRFGERALAPGQSDLASMAYCQQLFSKALDGHELLANNSKWLDFRTVRNETWHYRNIALMGDAAHTAHFSVGSGTKMAMEDAIALSQALEQHHTVTDALVEYERVRRPEVERIQRASRPSQAWWEEFRRYRHLSPEQFTFHFLTRNPGITAGKLGRRDPQFVALVTRWFMDEMQPPADGTQPTSRMPLSAPLRLRDVKLANRIVLALPPEHLTPGTPLITQAGLILLKLPLDFDVEVAQAQLQGFVQAMRTGSPARIGLHIPLLLPLVGQHGDGIRSSYTKYLHLADALDADMVELDGTRGPRHSHRTALQLVRTGWKNGKPLAICISLPEESEGLRDEELIEMADLYRQQGCDLIAIAPGEAASGNDLLRQRFLSDLIRNEVHIPTMLVGGLKNADEVNTLILSARADLYLVENIADFDLNG
ncbi:MAG: FAD-dependent monooxygenase [Ktedonobacteraceae bacterium]|nr:FAD-dependent monooxygenase [Ktedonobacteraceae bacterium]